MNAWTYSLIVGCLASYYVATVLNHKVLQNVMHAWDMCVTDLFSIQVARMLELITMLMYIYLAVTF